MVVWRRIVVGANVAAGKVFLNPLQKVDIDGHHIFVVAVNGAVLHHPPLAVALDDGGLDFANLLGEQVFPVLLPTDDRFARFLDAAGAERIRLAGPAELRLGLLLGLQQRLVRPLRREGRIGTVFVEELYAVKGHTRHRRGCTVHVFHRPLSANSWHVVILAFRIVARCSTRAVVDSHNRVGDSLNFPRYTLSRLPADTEIPSPRAVVRAGDSAELSPECPTRSWNEQDQLSSLGDMWEQG